MPEVVCLVPITRAVHHTSLFDSQANTDPSHLLGGSRCRKELDWVSVTGSANLEFDGVGLNITDRSLCSARAWIVVETSARSLLLRSWHCSSRSRCLSIGEDPPVCWVANCVSFEYGSKETGALSLIVVLFAVQKNSLDLMSRGQKL